MFLVHPGYWLTRWWRLNISALLFILGPKTYSHRSNDMTTNLILGLWLKMFWYKGVKKKVSQELVETKQSRKECEWGQSRISGYSVFSPVFLPSPASVYWLPDLWACRLQQRGAPGFHSFIIPLLLKPSHASTPMPDCSTSYGEFIRAFA